MKKFLLLAMLVIFPAMLLSAQTGREIIEKSDALPEGDTGRSKVTMKITKDGRVSDKEFILSMKKIGKDEERILVEFTKPTEIKLLTHTHNNREDDQWLQLSSGKVKRIASSDKDKPFVNSHFFYEDMESRDIDDYDYKYTGDKKAAGEDCYTVEAVKKNNSSKVYDKSVIYVRKSDYFTLRVDFYRNGKFFKYLENHNVKKVNGILTPYKVIMMQSDEKGGTVLNVHEVKYNIQLQESLFNKDSLR
jgi:hypothetical protein